jgi:hypothetical protein
VAHAAAMARILPPDIPDDVLKMRNRKEGKSVAATLLEAVDKELETFGPPVDVLQRLDDDGKHVALPDDQQKAFLAKVQKIVAES